MHRCAMKQSGRLHGCCRCSAAVKRAACRGAVVARVASAGHGRQEDKGGVNISSGSLWTCAEGDLRDLGALARVFVAREGRLLGALAGKMAGAQGGRAVFEVWMKQQSDLVQVRAAAPAGCLHRASVSCRKPPFMQVQEGLARQGMCLAVSPEARFILGEKCLQPLLAAARLRVAGYRTGMR